MKRLLKHTILFALVAIVAYPVLLCLLGDLGWVRTARTEMSNRGSRIKDIRNYRNVDVLFLGSSHCYRTFDTRFYRSQGISCFNLGSSNQTPVQTYVLLKAYLDSINPRFVVFEVHPDIMKNDGIECAVDLLMNTPMTCEATKMAWHTGNMKVINTWLYSLYNQKIRNRLERFHEEPTMDDAEYIPGGYVEINTKEFERKRYSRHNLFIRPEQMEALKQCLNLLKELPFDTLKIDGEFFRNVTDANRANIVVNNIIELAKSLHMTVVAEGIETQEQVDFLRTTQCDLIQGYFYSKPLSAKDFEEYMSRNKIENKSAPVFPVP